MSAATARPFAAEERRAAIVGAVLLAAGAAGFVVAGAEQFYRSYLHGFAFVIGIPFGCLMLQMIHSLTGGRWGMPLRRHFIAAATTLPLLAVLFLPVLAGQKTLYPWTRPEAASDPILVHKAVYLDWTFFIGRAAVVFVVWTAVAFLLRDRVRKRGFDEAPGRAQRVIAGPGIVLCALTMSLAAVDWLMSIEPHWFSTMFPVLVIVGQMLSAMCFVVAGYIHLRTKHEPELDVDVVHDLGNLLLVFTMLWAYCAYSQYLIIYAGNLSEDVTWYIPRSEGGWRIMAIAMVVGHFVVPFMILLSRRAKRSAAVLGKVAFGLLIMRLVELFWMCAPSFYGKTLAVHWLDVVLPVGLGALWLAVFLRRLTQEAA
ncbi:MAG: hypothetical protein RIF41_07285 [Polyangiaceae bacterium]